MENVMIVNQNSILYSELLKLKAGDYSSYEYFFSITYSYVSNILEEISGNTAVNQENINKIYNAIYSNIKENECETFYMWAGDIATSVAIETCLANITADIEGTVFELENKIPEKMSEDEERFISEDVLINSAIQQVFYDKFEKLNIGQKIILQKYFYYDKSISEISLELNIHPFSIRRSVAYIRKKMSDIMVEFYGENYYDTHILHSLNELPIAWLLFCSRANIIQLSVFFGGASTIASVYVGEASAGTVAGCGNIATEGGGSAGTGIGAAATATAKVGIGFGVKIGIACTAIAAIVAPIVYNLVTMEDTTTEIEIMSEAESSEEDKIYETDTEYYIEETGETTYEETSESDTYVVDINLSQEENLLNYVYDELAPVYGFADLSYEEKGDRTEEDWIFYDGVISAYVDDFDLDGNQEMIVSRIQNEADFNRISLALYTIEDDKVIETDSIVAVPFFDDYNNPNEMHDEVLAIHHNASCSDQVKVSIMNSDNLGEIIYIDNITGIYYSEISCVSSAYMIKDDCFVLRYQECIIDGLGWFLYDEKGELESYQIERYGDDYLGTISIESLGIHRESENALFFAECSMNYEKADVIITAPITEKYKFTYRKIEDYSGIREYKKQNK